MYVLRHNVASLCNTRYFRFNSLRTVLNLHYTYIYIYTDFLPHGERCSKLLQNNSRSLIYCVLLHKGCYGKATMCSIYIVTVYVSANNVFMVILCRRQQLNLQRSSSKLPDIFVGI